MNDRDPTLRVMSLHALEYCERLFYLEEIEEIRVADARVWAGRTLHKKLESLEGETTTYVLESSKFGLRGKVDAIRERSGEIIPIEHKRGRSRHGCEGSERAWSSDRLQLASYALLLEEHLGKPVSHGRVRYHTDSVSVRVPIDHVARENVARAVQRAQELRKTTTRPAVTEHAGRCTHCSLAPVCLPEEARFLEDKRPPKRLFPADSDARSLHIVDHKSRLKRSGNALVVETDGSKTKYGVNKVSDVCVHGNAQVTTQALRLCAVSDIPVHFTTTSGSHLGVFISSPRGVQRRLRQYAGLSQASIRVRLARRLLASKVELQLRFILRATRKTLLLREEAEKSIAQMRLALKSLPTADSSTLLGHEGAAARCYFTVLSKLVMPEEFKFPRRSRRPPEDAFNALISFGYSLLYRDVLSALFRIGLEPAMGFLHQPRSNAQPLALDLMELFRVPVVDMSVLAAVNRGQFGLSDFRRTKSQVWLTDSGRRTFIGVYEKRKQVEHKHPALGYRVSYARMFELESRLLEKEWSGEPGLFAQLRIR